MLIVVVVAVVVVVMVVAEDVAVSTEGGGIGNSGKVDRLSPDLHTLLTHVGARAKPEPREPSCTGPA